MSGLIHSSLAPSMSLDLYDAGIGYYSSGTTLHGNSIKTLIAWSLDLHHVVTLKSQCLIGE
jgi:hypothetical protein